MHGRMRAGTCTVQGHMAYVYCCVMDAMQARVRRRRSVDSGVYFVSPARAPVKFQGTVQASPTAATAYRGGLPCVCIRMRFRVLREAVIVVTGRSGGELSLYRTTTACHERITPG